MSETIANFELVETPIQVSKKAAIIDDAFDDVVAGEISFAQFREFHQISSDDESLEKVLAKLDITIPDFSDWDDDSPEFLAFLKTLWSNKEDVDLKPLINTDRLFANKFANLNELETLCQNIEGQNIVVERFKSTINDLTAFQQGDFVYIFIDYNLGVRTGEEAIKNAQKVAKEIYEKCPKEKRPVTILMSSDPNLNEEKKEQFQQNSGMLEGVFRFTSKSDLVDKNKVSLLVRAYGEEFYSNHILQDYIQGLIKAAKNAQEEFEREVMILKIEDYEFMQHSVLQDQQQPLGDYLAWLYGSYWANLLLKNGDLKEKQANIDSVISKKAPLYHSVPSVKLSEIFMSALFEENLEEIKYHPWEGHEENVAKLPYLHLGDIFTKPKEKSIFLILNPQCDLERPTDRKSQQSIFIVPGHLDSLDNVPDPKVVKTDFFIFEDMRYRIYWDLLQIKTVQYDQFEVWQMELGLERKFRLRLPFALEIQQRFTSNMSRVGLPVSPPFTKTIDLEVLYKDHINNSQSLLVKDVGYAFLPVTKNAKLEIRLTLKFALDFKAALIEEHLKLLQLRDESVGNMNMPAGLVKHVEKLATFIAGFDDWFFKSRGLQYPEEGKFRVVSRDFVSITLDAVTNASPGLFLINVVTKGTPAAVIEEISGAENLSEKTDTFGAEFIKNQTL